MLSREGKQTDRGAVGAEFIGYNRRRREALLLQEFPHQPNCRPSVPAGLNQEIQDFALTVHGTPEIELPPSNYDDHLVQVPAFGRSWPPTLNPPRIGPTEFQDPSSNCLIRDVETTLGKQVLNVPIAQRETAIEPDGMLDDDRWKAVTTVGYLAHPETLKHRPCRSHAVNVTMPIRFPLAELVERGQGFKDGGQDVRDFRAAVLGDHVRPSRSLLLTAAMGEERVIGDPAGNWKLGKHVQGGRRANARDDACAAAIVAVAEGYRRWTAKPKGPRWRYRGMAA